MGYLYLPYGSLSEGGGGRGLEPRGLMEVYVYGYGLGLASKAISITLTKQAPTLTLACMHGLPIQKLHPDLLGGLGLNRPHWFRAVPIGGRTFVCLDGQTQRVVAEFWSIQHLSTS